MVNNKEIILSHLKSYPIVSGDSISKELGISRVAVWKNIQTLIAEGYPIRSLKKGYTLDSNYDLINQFELGHHGIEIVSLDRVESTMNEARKTSRPTAIIAKEQTGGRGRFGREWISSEGGLYLTVTKNVTIPVKYAFLMTLAASFAVAHACEEVCGVAAAIKWPNDIFAADRKIAGILCEITTDFTEVSYASTGIGVNLANIPVLDTATSLNKLSGKNVSKKQICDIVLRTYLPLLEDFSPEKIISLWKSRSLTIGRRVKATYGDTSYTGIAEDIAPDGSLIIKEGNRRITFNHGDLKHLE